MEANTSFITFLKKKLEQVVSNLNHVIKSKFDDKMYKMTDFTSAIWVFNVDHIIFVYGKFTYSTTASLPGISIVPD